MNVYVNNISVPRIARNKRVYTGYSSNQVTNGSTQSVPGKAIIEFTNDDSPGVVDYNTKYAKTYGQYPTVTLTTIDEYGNRVERTERPYFMMVDGLIDSIIFGTLPEAVTGFITLSR